MCEIITTTLAAIGAGSAATGLATVGTLVGVGGTLMQGAAQRDAANAQARAIEVQKQQERNRNAVQDQRSREQFARQIRQQSAQIGARGFALDSPTAVFLGQSAAEELAFQSQSVRQSGQATQTELTNSQQALRARGRNAASNARFSAAGTLLRRAPDMFPELLS